jgi:hypothetical protein
VKVCLCVVVDEPDDLANTRVLRLSSQFFAFILSDNFDIAAFTLPISMLHALE